VKHSAGIVVYRRHQGELEVLLVHASGHYNRGKPWSIPKGLPDEGESLEDAARRETLEEAGVTAGELVPLGSIDYTKSRKRVHAFAAEWLAGEPHCASWEIDQVEWCSLERARELIHPEQRPFLDRLSTALAEK
jgi:predicted NUDIX family NTP pyrophosphohydrolase